MRQKLWPREGSWWRRDTSPSGLESLEGHKFLRNLSKWDKWAVHSLSRYQKWDCICFLKLLPQSYAIWKFGSSNKDITWWVQLEMGALPNPKWVWRVPDLPNTIGSTTGEGWSPSSFLLRALVNSIGSKLVMWLHHRSKAPWDICVCFMALIE